MFYGAAIQRCYTSAAAATAGVASASLEFEPLERSDFRRFVHHHVAVVVSRDRCGHSVMIQPTLILPTQGSGTDRWQTCSTLMSGSSRLMGSALRPLRLVGPPRATACTWATRIHLFRLPRPWTAGVSGVPGCEYRRQRFDPFEASRMM